MVPNFLGTGCACPEGTVPKDGQCVKALPACALADLPRGAREFLFDVLTVSKIYRVSLLKADQHALSVFGDMAIGYELRNGYPLLRNHSDSGRNPLLGPCEALQDQGVVHHGGLTFLVAGEHLFLGR